ncbi:M50 family metallopeptidase [Fimbriimonadia bacterium ATM]|nr:MAG: M50 family peptidase [Armatimonadota bacterium]MBC6969804.1 M50 family peptidase [Armatimonadota bacterium]MCE7899072.1 M50 family peptidase [Armatimonadetes bacterium ATM1]MDL1927527.1 M50 family metallopeptidase [Fimbriimonadia bacterium ATM]RIJ95981.1 MAG: hypothetical protein DCC45_08965 [Armatimonadota bacterium]
MTKAQKGLLAVIFLAVAMWIVPLGYFVVLPLAFLNTHFHELLHAVTAVATGGSADRILVFADGSGMTPVTGGWLALVASAGYVGCAAVGGVLILCGRSERAARRAFAVCGGAIALSLLLWVRGDGIGFIAGVFWAALLLLCAYKLPSEPAKFAIQFLGAMLALSSLQSLLVLVGISAMPQAQSDAALMERATGLPALVWAVAWSAIGVVVLAVCVRRAFERR